MRVLWCLRWRRPPHSQNVLSVFPQNREQCAYTEQLLIRTDTYDARNLSKFPMEIRYWTCLWCLMFILLHMMITGRVVRIMLPTVKIFVKLISFRFIFVKFYSKTSNTCRYDCMTIFHIFLFPFNSNAYACVYLLCDAKCMNWINVVRTKASIVLDTKR